MFDKKQKSCVKHIHLVTDDGLYDRKAFYKVKIVFYSPSLKMVSVFLINRKSKYCLRNSIFGSFGAKIWIQLGSINSKNIVFMPAYSQSNIPWKSIFLPAKLSNLKSKLADLHETL